MKGFINIDMENYKGVDRVLDLRKELPYKDNSVDYIFASHVIEHFWWYNINNIIKDWHRVLKPKGQLDIWTIDLEKIVNIYNKIKCSTLNDDMIWINQRLYAQHRGHEGDAHHAVLDWRILNAMLLGSGFCNVSVIDDEEFPFNLHGDINLGVRCWK